MRRVRGRVLPGLLVLVSLATAFAGSLGWEQRTARISILSGHITTARGWGYSTAWTEALALAGGVAVVFLLASRFHWHRAVPRVLALVLSLLALQLVIGAESDSHRESTLASTTSTAYGVFSGPGAVLPPGLMVDRGPSSSITVDGTGGTIGSGLSLLTLTRLPDVPLPAAEPELLGSSRFRDGELQRGPGPGIARVLVLLLTGLSLLSVLALAVPRRSEPPSTDAAGVSGG